MTLNLTRRNVKGEPLDAVDHDSNLDKLELAITRQPVRGQLSRTIAGGITITTAGQYVATGLEGTLDAATANGMTRGTTDLFGLKNTSGVTRLMRFYGSIDAADGNNQTLGIKLALQGTPIDETECRAFTGSGAQEAKLVTSWMISMAPDAEVSLMIANHSGTTNIELRRARLVASEVK
jgi:hypothetical protein